MHFDQRCSHTHHTHTALPCPRFGSQKCQQPQMDGQASPATTGPPTAPTQAGLLSSVLFSLECEEGDLLPLRPPLLGLASLCSSSGATGLAAAVPCPGMGRDRWCCAHCLHAGPGHENPSHVADPVARGLQVTHGAWQTGTPPLHAPCSSPSPLLPGTRAKATSWPFPP